jgi:hypothetical protein
MGYAAARSPTLAHRKKFDHRVHGENAVALAHGKNFDHRGHGENSLISTFQGKNAGVLRLALRCAPSRVAQDDKQVGW